MRCGMVYQVGVPVTVPAAPMHELGGVHLRNLVGDHNPHTRITRFSSIEDEYFVESSVLDGGCPITPSSDYESFDTMPGPLYRYTVVKMGRVTLRRSQTQQNKNISGIKMRMRLLDFHVEKVSG